MALAWCSRLRHRTELDILQRDIYGLASREECFASRALLIELLMRRWRSFKRIDASRTGHNLAALELLNLTCESHPRLRKHASHEPGGVPIVVNDL